jgi:hypothetical protein
MSKYSKINKKSSKFYKNKKNRTNKKSKVNKIKKRIINKKKCTCRNKRKCKFCKKMRGGGCGCGLTGGMNNIIPGSAWTSNNWSGENDQANYLPLNKYENDVQLQTKVGGKKRNNKRGGGIIPTDIKYLGEKLMYNVNSNINTLKTDAQPIDPTTTEGQLPNAKFN